MLKIPICKIGIQFTNELRNDDKVFVYKQKKFKLLDFLPNISIICEYLCDKQLRQNLILQEAEPNYLILYYAYNPNYTQGNIKRCRVLYKLFSTIFINFDECNIMHQSFQQTNNKTMKTYITTKLFDQLQKQHAAVSTTDGIQTIQMPTCFQPTLRHYQTLGVQWLLSRECQPTRIASFFTKLNAKDNETCVYLHKYYFELQANVHENAQLPPGGILADEMGLGKSVEIIALILLHVRNLSSQLPQALALLIPNRKTKQYISGKDAVYCICGSNVINTKTVENTQCVKCRQWQHMSCVGKHNIEHEEQINEPYLCPICWSDITSQQLVPSRATIIVTPNSIKLQWLAEFRKHVQPTLRVFLYEGIGKHAWISPRQLADYDVVLTDYTVLNSEIHHAADNCSERKMRKRPRFMRCNTPLLMIDWWRVCLDEAQLVESHVSQITKMAFKLAAVNRWAVSGTPIQNSIDDLQYLLQFIGFYQIVQPLTIWKNLVYNFLSANNEDDNTCNHLVELLQLCMWRTCKSKVINELNIPPQTEKVHYITLSNLEQLFYTEQHADCEADFNRKFDNYIKRIEENRMQIAEISPHVMKCFLDPLLKLRQCATTAVVAETGYNANNVTVHKKFLQPKDLHAHLKSVNEMECKSELRSMVSSYNGIAAVFFIRKQYSEAIRHYNCVLKLANDYQSLNLNVDSLLQIHALHNLIQAYNTLTPEQYPMVSAEELERYEEKCNALEWKYLEPYASNMKHAQHAFLVNNSKASQPALSLVQFVAELGAIVATDDSNLHSPLMEKVINEIGNSTLLQEVTMINSLLYIIDTWFAKVLKLQKNINQGFKDLEFFTCNVQMRSQLTPATWCKMKHFIKTVFDCHLSDILNTSKNNNAKDKQKEKKDICRMCTLRNILNEYECLLYQKCLDEETNLTEGLAIPSVQLSLLKIILTFTKSKPQFKRFSAEFDVHFEMLNFMNATWKTMLKYWIEIEYTIKAYDELDMCKMRISLTDNADEKSIFKILQHEVDSILTEQQMNLSIAQQAFTSKYNRLKYILHLEKYADPGACPICHSDNDPRYAVLECGHHVCFCCLKAVQQLNKSHYLSCSICRNQQNFKNIYYVTRTSEKSEVANIIGNYSSKISHIIHQINKLKSDAASIEEESPKIIIFSQWEQILSGIAAALKENNIQYRWKWSPQSIEEFKNPNMSITCMLMTLSRGSKGLNLIEATHVFLVEPILNPAEELQAIGRVHRFGQTKPTTVHRFIVQNTIEENIFNAVTKKLETFSNWNFENITLESLRNLFNLKNDILD